MPRNIVLCCDGTANSPSRARTNVLKLWLALERDDEQLVYYDPGVGTMGNPDALTGLRKRLSRALDAATGRGLRQNVIECYEYLMDYYEDGDRIFLFGFSRGAYTVRALAGMLQMHGLAPPGSRNLIPYLWGLYSNDQKETSNFGKRYRISSELKALHRQPKVHFIGAWDTVSSWGLFFNFRSLPYTARIECAEHIRHAVALHERWAAFKQNLFSRQDNHDLKEVGFLGAHGNVGGGQKEEESGLSKIALEWMFDEAEAKGLRFRPAMRSKLLGRANKPGRTQYSKPDPHAKMHKSLRGLWWLLEFLPRRVWLGQGRGYGWRINRGAPRHLPEDRLPRHPSVAVRESGATEDHDG